MSARLGTRKSADYCSDTTPMIEEKITKVNGEVTTKRYAKGRFLGKGGFAKVYELTCVENRKL
jgi:hypothetical protein